MNNVVAEISNHLLFRYRLKCHSVADGQKKPIELKPSFELPELQTLDGNKPFAQVRAAWNSDGLFFWVKVKGKKQSLWCRRTQLLESDGMQIWLDTRDTHNLHRATKFCHWFMFLPAGEGSDQKKPLSTMLKINRAREHSPTINRYPCEMTSSISKSGYSMAIFVPGIAINGWDSNEHRLIGFNYAIQDRELGFQCLSMGMDFPISEDPSLWQTLNLDG